VLKKNLKGLFIFLLFGVPHLIMAQTIVNSYTLLTGGGTIGSTSLNVSSTAGFLAGDLIMIYQAQGATINGGAIHNNVSGAAGLTEPHWGDVKDYGNSGNYEFVQIASVGATLDLNCGLKNQYDANKAQVIKVAKYTSNTTLGNITCAAWNGSTGGVVAIYVDGDLTLNGNIDASGKGFRGGRAPTSVLSNYDVWTYWDQNNAQGGEKGESIAGWYNEYDAFGGRYCRGSAANGGGGGNGYNSAGGGGSNAYSPDSTAWNGLGNPDIAYASAWNLESPGFATNQKSSGGGRGGYGYSFSLANPFTSGPCNSGICANTLPWRGDGRINNGGQGGHPLDYSIGKIFMGGGGGAGSNDNQHTLPGGNGGGIVVILCTGTISGSGQIKADGKVGGSADANQGPNTGADAPSGGGGGGAIIVRSTSGFTGLTATANGGIGGIQSWRDNIAEAEGGGGGGGGGYIALFNGTGNLYSYGGASGKDIGSFWSLFPPNGGTMGDTGQSYQFPWQSDSVCKGGSVKLKIDNKYKFQLGANICWFDSTGANVASGDTFRTPTLINPATYYYGNCLSCGDNILFGYIVNIKACPINVKLDANPIKVCKGQSSFLSVSVDGGTSPYSYQWDNGFPANTVSDSIKIDSTTIFHITVTDNGGETAIDSVIVTNETPTLKSFSDTCQNTTSFILSGGSPAGGIFKVDGTTATLFNPSIASVGIHNIIYTNLGCSASQNITVKALPIAKITGISTICPNSSTTLKASGGGTYLWSDNITTTDSIVVSPVSQPTYTVTVTNDGCSATTTHTITVTGALTPTITTSNNKQSVCFGDSIQLNVSNALKYKWSTGDTLQTINTPALINDSLYRVTVYPANIACSGASSITIKVNPLPTAKIVGDSIICDGQNAVLTATGGDNYVWSTSEITNTIIVKPTSQSIYYVTAYLNTSGCSDSTHYIINIIANPIPTITTTNQRICSGTSATISATGGKSYSWNDSKTDSVITVSPTISTPFTVTVTNQQNCSAADTLTINVIPPPVNPQVNDIYLCTYNPIQDTTFSIVSPQSGYIFKWYDSTEHLISQGTTLKVKQVDASLKFYLETITADNCHSSSKESINIFMNNPPIASFDYTPKPIAIQYAQVEFKNLSSVDATKFIWNFGRNQISSTVQNPLYVYTDTGAFTIVLTAFDHNCQSKDSMDIYIKKQMFLWFPQAFTPNNDGNNDVFYVKGPIKTMKLKIYNQSGEKVFESVKQEDGWDGKYQGVEQPEGNYIWKLNAITTDELPVEQQGEVLLIR